jgi:hypothetical protein
MMSDVRGPRGLRCMSANLFRVFFLRLPENRHPACPGLPWERR